MKFFSKYILFAGFLLISGFVFTTCGKVKDSIAKVTVLDSQTGDPIGGATVILRPESSYGATHPTFKWDSVSAKTDAKGVATFNFNEDYKAGQAGLLVLTIDVQDGGAYYSSAGIIKVEEETTNEKTVEVP